MARGQNRCDICGRFFSYRTMDEYTNFGYSEMLEPPDPVRMCRSCSKSEENIMVKRQHVFSPWRPGRCHFRAAKRLGWKRAGPPSAAWSEFRPSNKPLPKGWEWRQ